MGLFDVFSKGGKYFGKAIEPKCEYCEHGNRAKDGNKVLCTKKGLVDASYHCPKFLYSPLKRIPVKQLERVGWLEGDYEEKDFAAIQKKREEEAKAADSAAKAAQPAPAPVTQAPKPAPAVSPTVTPAPKPAPAVSPTVTPVPKPTPAVSPSVTPAPKPAPAVSPSVTPAPKPAPAASPSVTPAPKPAPAASPSVTPAPKPTVAQPVSQLPRTAGRSDLASLAAMAEAAGEYNPEPASAEEAPQDNNGMNALSSM